MQYAPQKSQLQWMRRFFNRPAQANRQPCELLHALTTVLFVGHLFHPIDHLAIEVFLNSDMCHRGGGRSPMPVLLAGRNPDHIARANFLHACPNSVSGCNRPLRSASGRADAYARQFARLARKSRSRLEQRRIGRLKKRINPHSASEPLWRTLRGRLRTNCFDLHRRIASLKQAAC
jgi:hypothetical protein